MNDPSPEPVIRSGSSRGWAVLWLSLGLAVGGAAGFWGGRRNPADPAAAAAAAKSGAALTGGTGSSHATTVRPGAKSSSAKIAIKINGDDPSGTLHEILRLTNVTDRNDAMHRLLAALPPERWPEVLLALGKFADDGELDDEPAGIMSFMSTAEGMLLHIVENAPEPCLLAMLKSKEDKMKEEVATVLRAWAARDLPAALEFFAANLRGDPDQAGKAAAELAREFVKTDPDGTFQWILTLPEKDRANVSHDAFQTLSHRDPEAAARLLVDQKDLPNREDVAKQMAIGWAKTEPEKALKWATGLPPDLARDAIQGTVGAWADKSFDDALKGTAALGTEARDAAIAALADKSDASHLDRVVALVDAQPEGEGRASAAHDVMEKWAAKDAEAASAWLARQPPGGTRDHAIVGFAEAAAEKDPEAAFEWRAVIGDDKARREQLDQGIDTWLKKDPAAARAWVANSSRLSAEDRARLLLRAGR